MFKLLCRFFGHKLYFHFYNRGKFFPYGYWFCRHCDSIWEVYK